MIYRFDVILEDDGFKYSPIYKIEDQDVIDTITKYAKVEDDKVSQLSFGYNYTTSFISLNENILKAFSSGMGVRQNLSIFFQKAQQFQEDLNNESLSQSEGSE